MLGSGSYETVVLGQRGSIMISTTAAQTGSFGAITALTSVVFTTLTSGFMPNGTTAVQTLVGAIGTFTIPAGVTIYGFWTAVTLASGSAVLYNI